jgi:phage-related protein
VKIPPDWTPYTNKYMIHVARFEEAIYVLHAFQKRSRRTSRLDIDLGAKRYREVVSTRSRS